MRVSGLVTLLLILAFAVTASAEERRFKSPAYVCLTHTSLEEIVRASRERDTRHVSAVLDSGECVLIAEGTPYSIVKVWPEYVEGRIIPGRGQVQIRVYGRKGSVLAWAEEWAVR